MAILSGGLRRRVAVIGAGYVGASIAYAMSLRGLAREIVLVDKNVSKAYGEAQDIRHGIPFMGTSFVYAGDYSECRDCDLIIITAGRNRKPTETRLNLAADNVDILRGVIRQLQPHYNGGVVLIVANPVDVLVHCVTTWMGLPDGRVFGTGCLLDTSRFVSVLSDFLGLGTDTISASIVGEHGSAQFPLWSRVAVGGIQLEEYCRYMGIAWGENQRDNLSARVKSMGTAIIAAKERTHYGIATCVSYLADSILNQRATIVSVSSVLRGEYGIRNVALSVPSVVETSGVTHRLEEKWSEDELAQLSCAAVTLQEIYHQVKGVAL